MMRLMEAQVQRDPRLKQAVVLPRELSVLRLCQAVVAQPQC